ncbi:hypothetical protein ACFQ1M_16880 [Sungkyunkwania multivorans]|uniref:GIY-YIG domain-containing protein n=1 Tax=Sungkyunkwania multivorans TaxID=1173618 RepID=A0ABW3D343_9FLAO|nr:hypothetical protein [uncultured Aquimarina sp.]
MSRRPKYNYEKVTKTAKQYKTRGDFVKYDEPSYRWAQRNNVLNEICAHMVYVRKYWSLDSVQREARKYNSRTEFQKQNVSAYEWALRNKKLDSVCSHMSVKGHKYKRALYVYEFENNSAYIGLTFDYHKRDMEHRRRGRVFRELKKSSAKFIKLNKWLEAEVAQNEEKKLIEKYRNNGWRILNVVTAGSLGGNDIKWDDNSLKKEALKYKTIKEFREKAHGAYSTAVAKGFEKFGSHLKYVRNYWDLEKVEKEALNYSHKSDFREKSSSAYDWCLRNNMIDEICGHMKSRVNKWDLQKVKEIAKQYDSMTEFQKGNRSAFEWARKSDFFGKICDGMRPLRKSWNFELVIEEVKKYSSKAEFQKKSGSAYAWAQRNRLLEKAYKYLKRTV